MNRLRYENIKSTFFPRWDRGHRWTFAEEHCLGYGSCDNSRKKIIVNPDCPSLDATMIHEIAHAVATLYHNKKWQRRMEKAALRAESLGLKELAAEIRQDYSAYSNPLLCISTAAKVVYINVDEAVWETRGERSFEEVISLVADRDGFAFDAMLSKYKRLRQVYEKARRDYLREVDLIKRFSDV